MYSAPLGNAVAFNFTDAYSAPNGAAVAFNFLSTAVGGLMEVLLSQYNNRLVQGV